MDWVRRKNNQWFLIIQSFFTIFCNYLIFNDFLFACFLDKPLKNRANLTPKHDGLQGFFGTWGRTQTVLNKLLIINLVLLSTRRVGYIGYFTPLYPSKSPAMLPKENSNGLRSVFCQI